MTQARKASVVGLGEVLWDLLPGAKLLGGAPANFACHARALGAEAWLVSRVGNDPLGQEILERLDLVGVRTECVTLDPVAPTGAVSVELSPDGQPRFTIHEDVAWDRLTATGEALAAAARSDAICFGTLGQRSKDARAAILSVVAATPPGSLRIFDINLRQHFYSREIIETSLALASALKINDQELPVLSDMINLAGGPEEQISELARRYNLELVALTRGADGSLLYSKGRLSDHPGCPTKVSDTVGAGDAFTAATALGCLAGWDIDEINQRANQVAAYVCTQSGATPPIPASLRRMFDPDPG